MKDFRLTIAQGHFHSCDLIPTIIHHCGVLLLAQACPKMPCIYTSYNAIWHKKQYIPKLDLSCSEHVAREEYLLIIARKKWNATGLEATSFSILRISNRVFSAKVPPWLHICSFTTVGMRFTAEASTANCSGLQMLHWRSWKCFHSDCSSGLQAIVCVSSKPYSLQKNNTILKIRWWRWHNLKTKEDISRLKAILLVLYTL